MRIRKSFVFSGLLFLRIGSAACALASVSGGDRDNDGIPDDRDECPDQPETWNGFHDDDGCPDSGLVRLRGNSIELDRRIAFLNEQVHPESQYMINAVAILLQHHPEISQIEIAVHADERAPSDWASKSLARASAIKRALVRLGLAAERVQVKGYAGERPLCREHDVACWSRNRRVEITILKRAE